MKRILILLFGLAAYAVFFLTFLYLVAFVGNLQVTLLADALPWMPGLVPFSIDFGRDGGPIAAAVAVDLTLILLFALQHTVMARTGFKAWLKRIAPPSVERSVFVLLSSLVLVLLFWQWRPIPGVLWSAESSIGEWVGWSLFGAGFGIVLVSTFLIDHFDLFGLRQIWAAFRARSPSAPRFVQPGPYRWVRHPMYVGFLLAFWGTPIMTVGHLLFASAMTAYLLIGIRFEERDLAGALGVDYVEYRSKTPMLIPGLRRRASGGGSSR